MGTEIEGELIRLLGEYLSYFQLTNVPIPAGTAPPRPTIDGFYQWLVTKRGTSA